MSTEKFSLRIKVRKTDVSVEGRVIAKHRLWDFIHDIRENIFNWPDSDIDLANQIITSSFTILLPNFSGIEIDREIRNIYSTLNRDLPNGYMSLFSDSYGRYVIARLNNVK